MIEIKNLRIEDMKDGWSRAAADISFSDMQSPYDESSMWFATRSENRAMLSDDSYDAFLLVPLYLAMYHKQDLHICGKVSKRLYKNIMTYIQTILCEFSDDLSKVNVFVDGFTDVNPEKGYIIGTGISCGIDSLSTIYDHFVQEDDEDYKINAVFLFNCGTHGDYENPKTFELYEKRYALNKRAADEMNLPVYQINSNLHAFTHKIGEQKVGYFAIWSCILVFEKTIKKYYVSSCYEYEEVKAFSKYVKNLDMAEFCESYLVPLIRTETLELIIDGCQYRRSEKTERISDWEIANKYLNVCIPSEDGTNCSACTKCLRALVTLEAMGKLDKFSKVFDMNTYRKYSYYNKCYLKANMKKLEHCKDTVDYCLAHGYVMPPSIIAKMYVFSVRCIKKCVREFKKLNFK